MREVSVKFLHERDLRPEVMDDPGLDAHRHQHALRGLARINRLSRVAAGYWRYIEPLAASRSGRTLRVLDLATGAGDVPIALSARARRRGVALDVAACDRSQTALDAASERARRAEAAIRFFHCDVIHEPLPAGYDIITCALFLHHLDRTEATTLLANAAAAAGELLLVSDLRRCWYGLMLAHLATRLVTTSRVVHADGPQSVRAAFTLSEAKALARAAGIQSTRVRRCWPARFMMSWRPAAGAAAEGAARGRQ